MIAMSEVNMSTSTSAGIGMNGTGTLGIQAGGANGSLGEGDENYGASIAPTSSWLSRYGTDTTYTGEAALKMLQVRDDLQTLQVSFILRICTILEFMHLLETCVTHMLFFIHNN